MSQTPTLQRALFSPVSPPHLRRDSVTSEQTAKPANTHMLRINNLLNPMNTGNQNDGYLSLRSTPAYTANDSTSTPTPGPDTPLTPASTRRQKTGKGKAIARRAAPKGVVRYRSYECHSNVVCADSALRKEIIDKHRHFQVSVEGEGLISDYPKHIPYASDKKDFHDKTGRDAFEYFEYTFIFPASKTPEKVYRVMWDYQIGLVRITPFFKAFDFSKTTPAKAVKTNPGLEDLVHSITGGALAAQGYWMPFACARALCLTFCWDIRWVLTPVFGPEFVTQCLPPNHANYRRWKIENNIVRRAELQAENWRAEASRSGIPASPAVSSYAAPYIPMYQPPTSAPISNPGQAQRRLKENPTFKKDYSPFSADSEHESRGRTANLDIDEPNVSPKSSPAPTFLSGWTSINQRVTPPSAPTDPSMGDVDRSLHLLTQPYHAVKAQESAWRGLNGERSASPASMPPPKQTSTNKRQSRKRVAAPIQKSDDREEVVVMSDSSYKSSPASSTSSVMSSSPPLPPPKKARLTKSRRHVPADQHMASNNESATKAKESEHTEPDEDVVEAAKLLMLLHEDDKMLHHHW